MSDLNKEVLEAAIARVLDYPSAYMGGPSAQSRRTAQRVIEALEERGVLAAAPTPAGDVEELAKRLEEGPQAGCAENPGWEEMAAEAADMLRSLAREREVERRGPAAPAPGEVEELARLREAFSRHNQTICQTLGKALGYPWFKDDPVNFPNATEADGVCVGDHVAESLADEAAARIAALGEQLRKYRARLEEQRYLLAKEDGYQARALSAERQRDEAVKALENMIDGVDNSGCDEYWCRAMAFEALSRLVKKEDRT
jgi:hypothetical protein